MTSSWRPEHLAGLDGHGASAPVISPTDLAPMAPGYDCWDVGPVRTPDGAIATLGGDELWLALSAPAIGDPGKRHDLARLRLVAGADRRWRDLGPLFPDGQSCGSREWAGSGIYDAADGALRILYTAAGGPSGTPTFTQRIAATTGRLRGTPSELAAGDWLPHRVVLEADGDIYQRTDAEDGEPGFIKAFRDPFPFRDPADGREWLLFTGSLQVASSEFNGAIGIASSSGDGYLLLPPLIAADGVNNELERPHVVVHGGSYYLFFSTQHRTFAPGVSGPNGLYGFVGPTLLGPYEPINGSGLVVKNPDEEPFQAYSWLVLPDLRVASFVDFHSLRGRTPEEVSAAGPDAARAHFGGTVAPLLRLRLGGATAAIAR